jgi:Asp-tRNA(Asn)/Glu-tRNA(Gln) amidotransferase A subunit family amidase
MLLSGLSLCEAAERIRGGDMTAEQYAFALLERCESAHSLNAFTQLDPEKVIRAARQADRSRARGHSLGALHGVPVVVKDAIDVVGMPTTAGTPALHKNLARRTAPVVQRLCDAGAIVLGKTNLPELCFSVTGNNECTGAVRNPHDTGLTSGGSSAGTAAAVGAGLAPAGLGTDTSGSVRLPAAYCGVFGYRPSTGRYPLGGVVPMSHSRDTVGLMARRADDIALLDAVIAGEDELNERSLRGLRIGLSGQYFFGDLDDSIDTAVRAELDRLRTLGVTFVESEPPDFAAARAASTRALTVCEMPRDFEAFLADTSLDVTFEDVVNAVASPYVKSELEDILQSAGADAEAQYRKALLEILPRHRAEYMNYLEQNDLAAIAFPTAPCAPPPVNQNRNVTVNRRQEPIWFMLRNLVPATMLGAPALSIPAGKTASGLPFGLEFDGMPGADRQLLSIGIAWQRATRPSPIAMI